MSKTRSILAHTMGTKKATWFGVTLDKRPPTKAHRPAIWECMLGTVYAMDEKGVVKYFDYKWEDAVAYAGLTADRDPRLARVTKRVNYASQGDSPHPGKLVVWVKRLPAAPPAPARL